MQLSLILYLCFFLVFVFHWVTTVVTDLLTFLMFFALPFLPCYFGESEVLLHSDLCMPQSLSTTQSNGAGFMASEAQSQSLLRCTAAHPTAEAKVKDERQLFKKRKRTHQLESVCWCNLWILNINGTKQKQRTPPKVKLPVPRFSPFHGQHLIEYCKWSKSEWNIKSGSSSFEGCAVCLHEPQHPAATQKHFECHSSPWFKVQCWPPAIPQTNPDKSSDNLACRLLSEEKTTKESHKVVVRPWGKSWAKSSSEIHSSFDPMSSQVKRWKFWCFFLAPCGKSSGYAMPMIPRDTKPPLANRDTGAELKIHCTVFSTMYLPSRHTTVFCDTNMTNNITCCCVRDGSPVHLASFGGRCYPIDLCFFSLGLELDRRIIHTPGPSFGLSSCGELACDACVTWPRPPGFF